MYQTGERASTPRSGDFRRSARYHGASHARRRCRRCPSFQAREVLVHALPGFLLIGAPKTGTTTLFERLRRHPQVCGARE